MFVLCFVYGMGGGRVVGLVFVCNLWGMVLGICFPLELFMIIRFSLYARCLWFSLCFFLKYFLNNFIFIPLQSMQYICFLRVWRARGLVVLFCMFSLPHQTQVLVSKKIIKTKNKKQKTKTKQTPPPKKNHCYL